MAMPRSSKILSVNANPTEQKMTSQIQKTPKTFRQRATMSPNSYRLAPKTGCYSLESKISYKSLSYEQNRLRLTCASSSTKGLFCLLTLTKLLWKQAIIVRKAKQFVIDLARAKPARPDICWTAAQSSDKEKQEPKILGHT